MKFKQTIIPLLFVASGATLAEAQSNTFPETITTETEKYSPKPGAYQSPSALYHNLTIKKDTLDPCRFIAKPPKTKDKDKTNSKHRKIPFGEKAFGIIPEIQIEVYNLLNMSGNTNNPAYNNFQSPHRWRDPNSLLGFYSLLGGQLSDSSELSLYGELSAGYGKFTEQTTPHNPLQDANLQLGIKNHTFGVGQFSNLREGNINLDKYPGFRLPESITGQRNIAPIITGIQRSYRGKRNEEDHLSIQFTTGKESETPFSFIGPTSYILDIYKKFLLGNKLQGGIGLGGYHTTGKESSGHLTGFLQYDKNFSVSGGYTTIFGPKVYDDGDIRIPHVASYNAQLQGRIGMFLLAAMHENTDFANTKQKTTTLGLDCDVNAMTYIGKPKKKRNYDRSTQTEKRNNSYGAFGIRLGVQTQKILSNFQTDICGVFRFTWNYGYNKTTKRISSHTN